MRAISIAGGLSRVENRKHFLDFAPDTKIRETRATAKNFGVVNSSMYSKVLTLLGIIALVGLLAVAILSSTRPLPRAAAVHLVFAVGITPLILANMIWFTPVLTRTSAPTGIIVSAPFIALTSGLLLLFSLLFSFHLHILAALLELVAILITIWWMRRRARQTLGTPHPGLLWYTLALIMFSGGVVAILAGSIWPEYWGQLRMVHLHLNILGFITTTALGTLRVLLPTTAGFQDPRAGAWLHQNWRWILPGTLLIAAGSAISSTLSLIGLAMWLSPLFQLLRYPLLVETRKMLLVNGAAPTMTAALAGLLMALLNGGAHGIGYISTDASLEIFIIAFLIPLVIGAMTHLLPIWVHSRNSKLQLPARRRLGLFGGPRSLLLLVGGGLAPVNIDWAWILAFTSLGHFFLMVILFLTGSRGLRQNQN